jgi:membrane fusion protein, adhesin transport system
MQHTNKHSAIAPTLTAHLPSTSWESGIVPYSHYYTTSLQIVETPRFLRRVGVYVLALCLMAVAFLVFVPWRQNIQGSGKVTSFVPGVRPQTIDAQITGRILKWNINEGQRVIKGDTLAVLQDLNVNFMDADLIKKLTDIRNRTTKSQQFAVRTANQRVRQAEQRLLSADASYEQARIDLQISRIRFTRAQDLQKEGLIAVREMETALANIQKAQADSTRTATNLEQSRRDVEAMRNEEIRIMEAAEAAISEVDLRFGNASQRQSASIITAPFDGVIVNIAKVGSGQTVKDGERLATIVPRTNDQAVEVFIKSRDAAIVDVGRPVRLQFSGFPAFVFSGWENFSLNTFGGKVAVVDQEESGLYRVLIIPDSAQRQGVWPEQRFLRQGMPTSAFILLDDVSIGFELWRQLNGFPPIIPSPMDKKGGKSGKDDKKK